MLDHALQSAALAAADDAGDEMVLACLLHDLGHILGLAGEWVCPTTPRSRPGPCSLSYLPPSSSPSGGTSKRSGTSWRPSRPTTTASAPLRECR